ncbi:hypothetical protein Xhom_01982 [Xenorhabdus hominickii]|uniref:Uncharacterized protein n=1 Tax=Xenorhabdus hominickii TaxID=351679 RepID=A0A2G0QBF5_XENHO|nr:hypothetical protein Xhom_01982 [Xenorhabdus hominickii]
MLQKMMIFWFRSISHLTIVYSPLIPNSGIIHLHSTIIKPPYWLRPDREHTKMGYWYNGKELNQSKITQDKTMEYKKDKYSPLFL